MSPAQRLKPLSCAALQGAIGKKSPCGSSSQEPLLCAMRRTGLDTRTATRWLPTPNKIKLPLSS